MNRPIRTAPAHGRQSGCARQAGATMVEFAIVSPLALLMVLAIIQLGLMFSAKAVVNEAAFLAARAGSVANAQSSAMQPVLQKALIPFYQNTSIPTDYLRLQDALNSANNDAAFMSLQILNPAAAAFTDFGTTSSASNGHTYIPNDNLEYRPHTNGGSSKLSIQDANALKIKVVYGYKLKVPLMALVVNAVMCGFDTGNDDFGRKQAVTGENDASDCTTYYSQGRIPIVSYATVQMQTPAYQDDSGG
jgi:hypothetical protein